MNKYQKMGSSILAVTFMSMLQITTAQAERALSVAYLSSNYKTCTGHCERAHINCDPTSKEHGSVKWCEKNCLNKNKADEYQFLQGINYCKAPKTES